MIHLVGKDYKVFTIPEDMIKTAIKQNEYVLKWYWSIVNE